jgi:hypothetical protein
MLLEYADKTRGELIQDILRMRQHIKDEKERCTTCRTVIMAEVEAGRRNRAAKIDTTKRDILNLQKKGVFIPSSKRSRLVD